MRIQLSCLWVACLVAGSVWADELRPREPRRFSYVSYENAEGSSARAMADAVPAPPMDGIPHVDNDKVSDDFGKSKSTDYIDCFGINVRGWLDAGALLNFERPPSSFHGPYNQVDRHEGSLNQAYLIFERPLDCNEPWDIGGRLDLLYGTDFWLAQSMGLERNPDFTSDWNGNYYGLAIPQMYAQFGNPDLSLKLGHFYSVVGYEGVPATGNFFYSKSLSYMFAGPFTHWGALATYNPGQYVSMDAGLVNGWNALDRTDDSAAFMGRVKFGTDDSPMWTSFAIITGDELNDARTGSSNRTRFSAMAGWDLPNCTEYVIHYWHGGQDDFLRPGVSAEWYGIEQYLYHQLSSTVRVGGRFEWFRDDDGVRLGLSRPDNPNRGPYVGNCYSFSVGLNWTPTCNVMVRPEIRYDWFNGSGLPFEDGSDDRQAVVGADVIWTF